MQQIHKNFIRGSEFELGYQRKSTRHEVLLQK